MLSEETTIQQNDGVDMLPLELGLLYYIYQGSGGSRILKRGVPVCDLSARRAPARGVSCLPGKFWISDLRSFLMHS